MTDPRDGKTYKTTVIDGVTWMAENLNYDITGSMCYEYLPKHCETYGRLYREAQRTDACPMGWRLPDTTDVRKLRDLALTASYKAQRGWRSLENGTDDYGFSALPGGNYDENRDPQFEWLLYVTDFWISTDEYVFSIGQGSGRLSFGQIAVSAVSIRCIKEI